MTTVARILTMSTTTNDKPRYEVSYILHDTSWIMKFFLNKSQSNGDSYLHKPGSYGKK